MFAIETGDRKHLYSLPELELIRTIPVTTNWNECTDFTREYLAFVKQTSVHVYTVEGEFVHEFNFVCLAYRICDQGILLLDDKYNILTYSLVPIELVSTVKLKTTSNDSIVRSRSARQQRGFFSNDGSVLAIATSMDLNVYVTVDGSVLVTQRHFGECSRPHSKFSNDNTLFVVFNGCCVERLNVYTQERSKSIMVIRKFDLSPDGSKIVCVNNDNACVILNSFTLETEYTFEMRIHDPVFDSTGSYIVYKEGFYIRVVDLNSNRIGDVATGGVVYDVYAQRIPLTILL
jgi:hypothetical protein